MQLKIVVTGLGGVEIAENQVIKTFDDLDKLALRVGRAVKRWVREVPLRKQGSSATITLKACWVERGGEKPETDSPPRRAGKRPRRPSTTSESPST